MNLARFLRAAIVSVAIAAMPIAAPAQVFGPPGINSLPSIGGWNSTLVTAAGTTVIKNRPGILFGIQNVGVVSQPAGNCVLYDNASTPTGKTWFEETQLGPGQILPFGGSFGLTAYFGITINCAVAPSGTNLLGILVIYE